MKYLKITMTRGSLGQDAMLYPAPYNAQEVDRNKRGPIVYEGAFGMFAEATEECLIYAKDALADAYAAASSDMHILTEGQADTWLAANRALAKQPEERINPERLGAIKLKYDLGEDLSEEDLRALDPDDPIPGINRRKKTAKGIFEA